MQADHSGVILECHCLPDDEITVGDKLDSIDGQGQGDTKGST